MRTTLRTLSGKINKGMNNGKKKISGSSSGVNLNSSVNDLYSRMKNPRTEGGHMMKRIAMGVGICCIGIFASIIGLR
jgi:hypothetical protein